MKSKANSKTAAGRFFSGASKAGLTAAVDRLVAEAAAEDQPAAKGKKSTRPGRDLGAAVDRLVGRGVGP